VTSRQGTGKPLTFFTVHPPPTPASHFTTSFQKSCFSNEFAHFVTLIIAELSSISSLYCTLYTRSFLEVWLVLLQKRHTATSVATANLTFAYLASPVSSGNHRGQRPSAITEITPGRQWPSLYVQYILCTLIQ
jgi:hypothetical protein